MNLQDKRIINLSINCFIFILTMLHGEGCWLYRHCGKVWLYRHCGKVWEGMLIILTLWEGVLIIPTLWGKCGKVWSSWPWHGGPRVWPYWQLGSRTAGSADPTLSRTRAQSSRSRRWGRCGRCGPGWCGGWNPGSAGDSQTPAARKQNVLITVKIKTANLICRGHHLVNLE